MQFKTELHAHTREASACADFSVCDVVDKYLAAGYSTLVLTNHYTQTRLKNELEACGISWVEHFIGVYHKMRDYANGKMNILLGCEIRFPENDNDYLVFGVTEEFLRKYPDIHKMSHKTFSTFARENGLLFVQAHPFRDKMTMVNPKYLDGMEVYNAHFKHDSRNYLANEYATRLGLIRTSGGDFHHPEHVPGDAGIITDFPITTMDELVQTLKSGNYTLICRGAAAARDKLSDMPAK